MMKILLSRILDHFKKFWLIYFIVVYLLFIAVISVLDISTIYSRIFERDYEENRNINKIESQKNIAISGVYEETIKKLEELGSQYNKDKGILDEKYSNYVEEHKNDTKTVIDNLDKWLK